MVVGSACAGISAVVQIYRNFEHASWRILNVNAQSCRRRRKEEVPFDARWRSTGAKCSASDAFLDQHWGAKKTGPFKRVK